MPNRLIHLEDFGDARRFQVSGSQPARLSAALTAHWLGLAHELAVPKLLQKLRCARRFWCRLACPANGRGRICLRCRLVDPNSHRLKRA